MTVINFTLAGTVNTATGSIEDTDGNVVMPVTDGPPWSKDLPPGTYVFICSVSGSPGLFGPLAAADDGGAALGSRSGNINRDTRTGAIELQFVVPAPANGGKP
ncbi:MAG TPA: hypothetical protein VHZ29_10325 [Rhizomicrobium sp.]|nr:hypothetical protein [Rhizomicrobium sp.]